jgi:hypothetical protein
MKTLSLKFFILIISLIIFQGNYGSITAQDNSAGNAGQGDEGRKRGKSTVLVPFEKDDILIQGYAGKISGTDIKWNSHLSYAKEAMIVRTKDGIQTMEWQSEAVPANLKSKYLTVIWISGISGLSGKTPVPITLYANDKKIGVFITGGAKDWDITGDEGVKISFREKMRDVSDDRYGFMFLRLPKKFVTPGQAIRLRIEGADLEIDSWTMVFKSPIEKNGLKGESSPVVLKSSGQQVLRLYYSHFGVNTKATIQYGTQGLEREAVFGENIFDLPLNPVKERTKIAVKLTTGSGSYTCDVEMTPVRKWEANFMQITHTDIGYTRTQTDILSDHVRFLDYVLDFCDATDNYPEESKFRWTCENTWAVTEFMNSRPQKQIDRFKLRVKEGRIEISAMNLNFDGLSDEHSMAESLLPLRDLKAQGLPLPQIAIQNDVNGIAWSLNENFPDIGVKYLAMGVNNYYQVAPFDMPSYFWWTSPSGKKMLAYYGEHYMQGNALGVNGTDFENFEQRFLKYLSDLEQKDFKYDILGIQFLGIGGDNSAPSIYACDIVKKWNEKYEYPKVRLSLFSDYMGRIEAEFGKDIPSIRGAFPDWWDLGYAASARETAAARITHSEVIANQTGFAMAKLAGSAISDKIIEKTAEVNQTLLFYDEHTFGFHASIWQPFGRETMDQRLLKGSYAWEAFRRNRLLREAALGFLNEHVSNAEQPSIVVYNPLSWNRSGLARTYIDFTILPIDKKVTIVDENGKEVMCQMQQRKHDGAYWDLYVEDVPALGYKQYFVKAENSPGIVHPVSLTLENNVIENAWYRMELNIKKGSLVSLYDKQMGQELLDSKAPWQFGELIHEQLSGRFPDVPVKDPARESPAINFKGYSQGLIWDTYSFSGHSDAGMGDGENMSIELRIFRHTKRIDLSYRLMKKLEIKPEAVYVAFPFELPEGKIHFEVQGGLAEAGVDQLIGTSNDWNTTQNFAAVKNDKGQIVLGTPEIPMMLFGDINIGRFQKTSVPASNKIYSWVMNNYWTTNFNADQHGEFEWNYFITSMDGNSVEEATKFAWGNRVPFLVRTLPAGKREDKAVSSASFLQIVPGNVALVNMSPMENENSVLLQLREIDGKKADIKITSAFRPDLKVIPSDVLGEERPENNLGIDAWETKFVKISW